MEKGIESVRASRQPGKARPRGAGVQLRQGLGDGRCVCGPQPQRLVAGRRRPAGEQLLPVAAKGPPGGGKRGALIRAVTSRLQLALETRRERPGPAPNIHLRHQSMAWSLPMPVSQAYKQGRRAANGVPKANMQFVGEQEDMQVVMCSVQGPVSI